MLWIAARIDAEKAVAAKSEILTRATGTPRLRAAVADPPTPAIQLPNSRPAQDLDADDRDQRATTGSRP